jgi:photosystem II stability/assembly factor-like uncharacterized protein
MSLFAHRCAGQAHLRWSSVANAGRYTVLRDGQVLATQDASTNMYRDEKVEDGKTYRYQIEFSKKQEGKPGEPANTKAEVWRSAELVSEGRKTGFVDCKTSALRPTNILDPEEKGLGFTGSCSVVAQDAKSPSTLYLGHKDGGLLMSVNGGKGKDWFAGNAGLQSDQVVDILSSKDEGVATYAATAHGLFTNSGTGWTMLESFKKAAEKSGVASSMRLVPGITHVKAGGAEWLLVPSEAGVWSFHNKTWTLHKLPGCETGASSCELKKYVSLKVKEGEAPSFYALSKDLAFKAHIKDSKLSFIGEESPVSINGRLTNVDDMATDMHNPGHLLLLGRLAGQKRGSPLALNFSKDGGKTYKILSLPKEGDYSTDSEDLYSIAIDPTDKSGKTFWAHGAFSHNVWRSTDEGKTWAMVPLRKHEDNYMRLSSVRFLAQGENGFAICSDRGVYRYDADKKLLFNAYPYVSTSTVNGITLIPRGRMPLEMIANTGFNDDAGFIAGLKGGYSWPKSIIRRGVGPWIHMDDSGVFSYNDTSRTQVINIVQDPHNPKSKLVVAGIGQTNPAKSGVIDVNLGVVIYTSAVFQSLDNDDMENSWRKATIHFPYGFVNKDLQLIPGSLQYKEYKGEVDIWLGAYDTKTKKPVFFYSTDGGQNWSFQHEIYRFLPDRVERVELPLDVSSRMELTEKSDEVAFEGRHNPHVLLSKGNVLYEAGLIYAFKASSALKTEGYNGAARFVVENQAEKILSFKALHINVPLSEMVTLADAQKGNRIVVFTEEAVNKTKKYRLRYWDDKGFAEATLPDNALQGISNPVVLFASEKVGQDIGHVVMVIKSTPASGVGTQTKMYRSRDGGKTWRDITTHEMELTTPTQLVSAHGYLYLSTMGSGIISIPMSPNMP